MNVAANFTRSAASRPIVRGMLALTTLLVVLLPGETNAQSSTPKRLPGSKVPTGSAALRGASSRPALDRSTGAGSALFSSNGNSVPLPYNMVWGDSQQRLSALFAGVGAKVTDKKANGPSEVWTVEGLIAPDLQSSVFTFSSGMLAAMEFDYGQPDWDLPKYNDKMGLFRRMLEIKCGGPGTMVSRDSKEEPNTAVKESLMGYEWDRSETVVQLFYFSAEDTTKALTYRTISVHYHYKQPAEEQYVPEPGGAPADPNSNPLFGGAGAPPASPARMVPTPAPTAEPVASLTSTPDSSASPAPSASPGPPAAVNPVPSPTGKPSPKGPDSDPLPEH